MPAVLVLVWTVLGLFGMSDARAFVFAIVLAQFAHLWSVLPRVLSPRVDETRRSVRHVTFLYVVLFALIALQVWQLNPKFSQRLISGMLLFNGAGMAWAAAGDRTIIDGVMPMKPGGRQFTTFRQHFAQVTVLVTLLAIAANEALIIFDAALNVRVGVLALLQLVLFYVFHIVLRLTVQDADLYEK